MAELMPDLVRENATLREMLRLVAQGWSIQADADGIAVYSGDRRLAVPVEGGSVDPRHQATVEVLDGLLPAIAALKASPLDNQGQKEVSAENLKWMANEIPLHPEWPIDKTSRWLGFIQGVLAVRGFMSVKGERDRTRSIFHRAYEMLGLAKPKSRSMEDDKALAK